MSDMSEKLATLHFVGREASEMAGEEGAVEKGKGKERGEARRERKRGERPKMAILVPEAMPMYCGKDFVAANTREK